MTFNKSLWWGYGVTIAVALLVSSVFNKFFVWEKVSQLWLGIADKLLLFEPSFYRMVIPTLIILALAFFVYQLRYAEEEYVRSACIVVISLLLMTFLYFFDWFNITSYELLGQVKALIILLFIYNMVSLLPFPSIGYDEDYDIESRLSAMFNLSFVFVWLMLIFGFGGDSIYRFWIGLGICVLNVVIIFMLFYSLILFAAAGNWLDERNERKTEEAKEAKS